MHITSIGCLLVRLLPYTARPYSSLNLTPYLNLTATLLNINEQQIRSLLRKTYMCDTCSLIKGV